MLVSTPTQLVQMSDGAVPEAIKGKVKIVYEPSKPKQGQYGESWLQKLIITDGQTDIQVMLDTLPSVAKTVVGSQLYAEATRTDRGLAGLKRKDNDYNNRVTPQVWVKAAANLTFEGAGAGAPPAQEQQRSSPPQNGGQQQNSQPPANGNGSQHGANDNGHAPATRDGIAAARQKEIANFNKRLGRSCSALNRCFDAAFKLAADVNQRHAAAGGFKPDAAALKEIATTLFIQTCGRNCSVADIENFPMQIFQSYEKPAVSPQESEHSSPKGVPFN